MLDVAWPELVVIGAVALVAIGPKDLPKAMHTLGIWAGKLRRFGHNIHQTFDQLTYEAEIAERLKKQAETPPASPPPPNEHDGTAPPAA